MESTVLAMEFGNRRGSRGRDWQKTGARYGCDGGPTVSECELNHAGPAAFKTGETAG
jgi:hypothetical protein